MYLFVMLVNIDMTQKYVTWYMHINIRKMSDENIKGKEGNLNGYVK